MSRAWKRASWPRADMDAANARIKGTLSLADFKNGDLVTEAAVENMQLKKTSFTSWIASAARM